MRTLAVPVPNAGDIRSWMGAIQSYLRDLQAEALGPRPLQVEHRKANAKATQDGIIMWDASVGTLVVSKSGAWYRITLGAVVP